MSASLALHDRVLRERIASNGGYVFSRAGDSFAAAFGRASDAVGAARSIQAQLGGLEWPGPSLRVRMGLHVGEAEERDGDYFGPVLNTAARVAAAGHGGQVLLTESVRVMAEIVDVTDLGAQSLRDVPGKLQLFQLGDSVFPPVRVSATRPTNLPVRSTRFIGREVDVSRVRQLLVAGRLVTITAVGGSGKTRLAVAVGEAELYDRAGGVWFVDLSAVMNAADVPYAIAGALMLTLRGADPVGQIIDYLTGKNALVVLDNCEHVVDKCADVVEAFLAVPGLSSILATSREALNVEGELVVPLGSLPTDSVGSAAVELFLDRAVAVDPTFTLRGDDAAVISSLCTHLDGMPLAIELAAARVQVMTPTELLAGLTDRFNLLSGGRRRQRQRTLEATLDWSYTLLEAEEQRVFRALGVFVDGFDGAAVAAVAEISRSEALRIVQALISKSLVARNDRSTGARFSSLETVKAYAEDRLTDAGEAAAARDRHLAYFHGRAFSPDRLLVPDIALIGELRNDLSNVASAFEWGTSTGKWRSAAELVHSAAAAFSFRGRAIECLAMQQRAIEHWATLDHDFTDHLRFIASIALAMLDDFPGVANMLAPLETSNVLTLRIGCLTTLGAFLLSSDRERGTALLERANDMLDDAIRTSPSADIETASTSVYFWRAAAASTTDDFAGALNLAIAAINAEARVGRYSPWIGMFGAAPLAAGCYLMLDQPHKALEILAARPGAILEGLHFATGDEFEALARFALGEHDEAKRLVRAHAERAIQGRYSREANESAILLAELAYVEGDPARAAELLLDAGPARQVGLNVYARGLARRLGITEARAQRVQAALTYDRDHEHGLFGTKRAMVALRAEVSRRGWSS